MPSVKATSLRVKALPWALMLEVTLVVGRRWVALSGKERARLARLLRASRGRPGNLSVGERNELRRLVRKLDINGARRELMPLMSRRRRRARR